MSIRRSGNIINSNQAYLYALGAETLAIIGLNEDLKQNKIDSYEDIWTATYDPFPVEDGAGYIFIQVSDLQSRFNVNSLVDSKGKQNTVAIERFRRLLLLFNINPDVTSAVIDWLDPNENAQGVYGAESDYYLGLEQPYRCANREITSVSELRLVRGLDTAERFYELTQHLTALPETTPINVNFAPYEIQYAIIGDANKAAAAVRHSKFMLEQQDDLALEEQDLSADSYSDSQNATVPRPNTRVTADSIRPYKDINDYIARNNLQNEIKNNKVSKQNLSVDSRYFLIEGESELDRARATVKSVLHRNKQGKIRVVFRTQGNL